MEVSYARLYGWFSMKMIGFENLIDFAVDVMAPIPPSASGASAIRGGRWHLFASGMPRRDLEVDFKSGPQPEPAPINNEDNIKLFNRIFLELTGDGSVPEFRDWMPDEEYSKFVEAYCLYVRDTDLRLRDSAGYFLDPIIRKFEADEFRSCWVPMPFRPSMTDHIASIRNQHRKLYRSKLKGMCMDSAMLEPYFVGSKEILEEGYLKADGARLFLASMGIVVAKEGFQIDYSDESFVDREFLQFLNQPQNVYRTIKTSVIRCFSSREISVASEADFDRILLEGGGAPGLSAKSELSYYQPNKKGWYVIPWHESSGEAIDGAKMKSNFRSRKCSDVVHSALLVFWRGGKEIPTRTSLRDYWFSLLRGGAGGVIVKINPNDESSLFLLDSSSRSYIDEAEVNIDVLVKRFVVQLKLSEN